MTNGKKFIATDAPSIADHQLFFQMTDATLLNIPLDNYPRIKKWMQNCESAPGIHDTHKEWMGVSLPKLQAMMQT